MIIKLIGKVLEIYHQLRDKFLQMVETIRKLNPAYKQPGDGSDGTCDCIGLEIGALRRMGLKWTGIHGSNYAARYQTVNLEYIEDTGQLEKGDIIYKAANEKGIVKLACNAGTKKHAWTLPDRYKKGRAYYDGDLLDYYHVGIVTGVDPLRITHMTSPTAMIDTKLGNWSWFGRLPWVEYDSQAEDDEPAEWATVRAEKGSTVKMRAKPSTLCRLYWEVPVGAQVVLTERGDTWSGIIYAGQSGYMMTKFLRIGTQLQKYTVIISGVTKDRAEEIVKQYGGEITAG